MAYLKWPSQQWPEDTEECHETPIMIDDNQAEIQTCYLQNISFERLPICGRSARLQRMQENRKTIHDITVKTEQAEA